MEGRCTGQAIFQEVEAVLTENNLTFSNCSGFCVDGAPAMIGSGIGLQGYVKKKLCADKLPSLFELIFLHCICHQENLAAKSIGLKDVMKKIVANVNAIRNNALTHRKFRDLMHEIDSVYDDIPYFTEVV